MTALLCRQMVGKLAEPVRGHDYTIGLTDHYRTEGCTALKEIRPLLGVRRLVGALVRCD
jgi:hypothetical protein